MRCESIQKLIDKIRGKKSWEERLNWDVRVEKSNYGDRHIYLHEDGNDIIYKELLSDKPTLICRYGSVELSALNYFLYNKENKIKYPEFIKIHMKRNAGFFPTTDYMLSRFSSELIDVTKNIDVIGVWFNEGEEKVLTKYAPDAKLVGLLNIDPVVGTNPWSKALKGKKVLVIHPFAKSIETQYNKREVLFKNPDTLPQFELKTIKPVQSIEDCVDTLPFKTWFEALENTKSEIAKQDFDIALIGAGAYGIFLADYCKRLGKKAVHMGGSTQTLFGIKGRRWEEADLYNDIINEHWISPLEEERPKGFEKVESGCYW